MYGDAKVESTAVRILCFFPISANFTKSNRRIVGLAGVSPYSNCAGKKAEGKKQRGGERKRGG